MSVLKQNLMIITCVKNPIDPKEISSHATSALITKATEKHSYLGAVELLIQKTRKKMKIVTRELESREQLWY